MWVEWNLVSWLQQKPADLNLHYFQKEVEIQLI